VAVVLADGIAGAGLGQIWASAAEAESKRPPATTKGTNGLAFFMISALFERCVFRTASAKLIVREWRA
jgi:hypothetical protein